MYGQGGYQSSDLVEMDYASIAAAMGCHGIRVERPDQLAGAIESGLDTGGVPTIVDVVVTREPRRMLPGVDSRTVTVKEGRPCRLTPWLEGVIVIRFEGNSSDDA